METGPIPAAVARLAPGSGALFAIVGPSGAGKDTLIHWLRHRGETRHVLFVRRTVTRDVDSEHEDHDTLSVPAFEAARARARFTVTWGAHGMFYGVPATALSHVRRGGFAVVNGSRKALPDLRAAFPNLIVVHVDASADVRAARLRQRGRETLEEIEARLDRAMPPPAGDDDTVHVDNSGPIEVAGSRILALMAAAGERLGTGPDDRAGAPGA